MNIVSDFSHCVRAMAVAMAVLALPDAFAQAPSATSKPAATPTAKAAASPADKRSADQLRLDATTITGNQGLPRVLYIVPWKRAGAGDLNGRPAGSLLDEVLAPVDRAEFRRQLRYTDALNASTAP